MGQGRRERDEGRREIREGEREGKERRGKVEGWGCAKGRVGDCSKGMAGMA
jgi:hypothetical protein